MSHSTHVESCARAGVAEVLAGEATAEDVDVWHRHGQRASYIALAAGDFNSSKVAISRGRTPAASSTA